MSAPSETVFYSWQSDSPGRFNRHFLEEAIKEALQNVRAGTALDPSPRAPQLEKDTLNVPGSPPITETILRKIDACAVFVADLTIVGQSLAGLSEAGSDKLFPNSNVVMEYGYALKSRGDSRLVAVTNEAFGGDVQESSLPFNLRHRRWPIRYRFGPDTPPGEKKTIHAQLVKDLTHAIGLILRESPVVAAAPFVGTNFGPSTFVQMAKAHELLIGGPYGDDIEPYEIPPRVMICLRLQPTELVPEFESEVDARDAAWQGQLRPMAGYVTSGRSPARNTSGGIVYEGPVNGKLVAFSQLFVAKEIYGLDARSAGVLADTAAGNAQPIFDIAQVEESFAITLRNYAKFAAVQLALPPPWKVQASVYGVKDLRLHPGTRCLKNEIHWVGAMTPDAAVLDVLQPFFNQLWKSFGSRSPDDGQQHLRELFADLDSMGQ